MTLTDKLAEKMAKRIDPKQVIERLGFSVSDEVHAIIERVALEEIEERVRAYINSDEFRERYREIEAAGLESFIVKERPVLIVDKSRFNEYKKEHGEELAGPIGTVNCLIEGKDADEAYDGALDVIKAKARNSGGNVIIILEEDQYYRNYSEYCKIIGEVYIRRIRSNNLPNL